MLRFGTSCFMTDQAARQPAAGPSPSLRGFAIQWQRCDWGSSTVAVYSWQGHTCVYDRHPGTGETPPILLIHPIGVGLSRQFWQPLINQWQRAPRPTLYVPDLLGCGDSDKPARAYQPEDWAGQLLELVREVIKEPVILVVQGALLPVALEMMMHPERDRWIAGAVFSGPPAWRLMTEPTPGWRQRLNWTLLASPFGLGFYGYARRRGFLESFSKRQLFDRPEDVNESWLTMLHQGSRDMATRYAVFAFLAGFWRRDYGDAIASLSPPVLVVMGEAASTIDRTAQGDTAQERLAAYLDRLPNGAGVTIPGRNVLPYESAGEFLAAVTQFIEQISAGQPGR